VNVEPYDPRWAEQFAAERARLEEALAPWLSGGVHHIGSTSVPGLAAKPIVDMMAGVSSLEESRAAFPVLASLDYVWTPHRPEAHRFDKPGFHLHLTEPGSALWTERLAFRDALLASPELRDEYAAWKREHFVGGDRVYDANKRPLVLRVLADQGIDLKPDEERLDPEVVAIRTAARAVGRL
jgi:GrpB-like predicted nucleotidyltransferase (UPF0157 family)